MEEVSGLCSVKISTISCFLQCAKCQPSALSGLLKRWLLSSKCL